jgi:hypothetical protein
MGRPSLGVIAFTSAKNMSYGFFKCNRNGSARAVRNLTNAAQLGSSGGLIFLNTVARLNSFSQDSNSGIVKG